MPIKRFLSSVVVLMVLASPGNLFAGRLILTYPVDLMCYKAPAIIEGTYLGQNNVRIAKIYKKDLRGLAIGKTIQVAGLGEHARKSFFQKTPIKTNQLVIFLTREESGHFKSYGDHGTNGSSGLYWYDQLNCYGYAVVMRGGFSLCSGAKAKAWTARIPKSIKDLRSEIKIGLKNFATWNTVIRLADPKKKTIALSKYLLKRTSPKNDQGTYRSFACEGLATLKKHSLPVLMDILKNVQPKDQTDYLISALGDLGPKAGPALPSICQLLVLDHTQRMSAYSIRETLKKINDSRRTIPLVRPFLKHKNMNVAVNAATILADHKDQQSFETIHSLIPKNPQAKDWWHVRNLLYALRELNIKKAAPIIEKMMKFKSMANLRNQFPEVKK